MIIVNDGSTDGTIERVNEYIKKYPDNIRMYVMPRERGKKYDAVKRASANRLNILKHSLGDIYCTLDGDDHYCDTTFIKDAVNIFKNKEDVSIVAFGFCYNVEGVLKNPILLPDTCPEETNVYDMRLTKHEDGYIYGVFCSESKDTTVNDLSAAVAAAGIVRTRDLRNWERLPNLVTLNSPQQRNVVLHPEFVDGKYAFYTRPMDDFIETGSGGGIGFGLCEDITHAVIDEEKMTSLRKYHTITEAKNGAGATPIKTDKGWIHIAHGVRNTAAGLRYVIYAFATDLNDPSKVIAEPSGLLIGPRGEERVGDVSNVVFTNGAIVNENNEVFIYYASSDTRMHVATTTVDKLVDYVFNTPQDPGRSVECVAQRCGLIEKNLEFLAKEDK